MKPLVVWLGVAAFSVTGWAESQDAKLTIEPGHTALIQQYVVTQRVQPAAIKLRIELGTVIPDDFPLQPVPLALVAKAPELRNYEYFVADGGKVVFVEPYTRHVVQIVQ